VVSTQVVGDHTVVLGKVDVVTPIRPQRPLLYGMRHFASWPGPDSTPSRIPPERSGKLNSAPTPEEAP
jgi:hypothetical protein